MPAHEFQKFGYRHIPVKFIDTVTLPDNIALNGIRLVPDITDELLQDILHGDKTQGSSVFVRDDGEMLLRISQRREHRREFHGLVNITGRKKQRPDLYLFLVDHGLQAPVQGQNSDDVVNAVLIDRNAGIG